MIKILDFVLHVIFLGLLLAVSAEDVCSFKISDKRHMEILALALPALIAEPGVGVTSRIAGLFCVSVPMLCISLVCRGAFGGGDIKLMAVCGAFLGWKRVLLAAVFGIVLAGVVQLPLLITGRRRMKDHFPLGPFLCAGMVIGIIFAERLLI